MYLNYNFSKLSYLNYNYLILKEAGLWPINYGQFFYESYFMASKQIPPAILAQFNHFTMVLGWVIFMVDGNSKPHAKSSPNPPKP